MLALTGIPLSLRLKLMRVLIQTRLALAGIAYPHMLTRLLQVVAIVRGGRRGSGAGA